MPVERIAEIPEFKPPDSLWPHVSRWTGRHWRHWLRQHPDPGWTEARIDQYLKDTQAYGLGIGLGEDQPVEWLYLPTPKQVELHSSQAPNLLFGGAAGGAKSHALRWDAYKRCLALPAARCLLMRRQFVELKDTHLDRARLEAPRLGARLVDEEVRFPNDSVIRFGHCLHEGDELRYLSTEYDGIYLDELATFTFNQAIEIMSRARSAKEGVQAMVRAGSNPGGAHTLWIVDRFIDHSVDRDREPLYRPAEWAFVPACLWDNPWLMDLDGTFRRYTQRLSALPPLRRRQLLEGDWGAITGQYFPEFSPSHHVRVLDLPKGTRYIRAIDWGYSSPGVCLWLALLPDGRLYLRHEYKFERTLVAEVAARIRQIAKDLDLTPVAYTVTDPAMQAKTGAGEHGESMSETLSRFGVFNRPGDNDRLQGWQRLRHWLSDASDDLPWLLIHPSCRYSIRTLPALVTDTHNPEDVDTGGDDHAADALRYAVMSRPAPKKLTEDQGPAPWGSINWLKKIAARESQPRRINSRL